MTTTRSRRSGGLYTPERVQRFLDGLAYNFEERGPTLRTLPAALRAGEVHCLEAALAAATLLERHGYPPLLLDLRSVDLLDHVVFLFERRGRWGTVGRSRDPGLHGRRPVFATLEALVRSYMLPFIDATGRLRGWATYDLRRLKRCDWRGSPRNVWAVERALLANRGHRLPTPEATYRRWHRWYLDWKREHPDRRPRDYPGRATWMSAGPADAVVGVTRRV